MYLGDVVKSIIRRSASLIGIKISESATCGCERRRSWLNDIDKSLRARLAGWSSGGRSRNNLASTDVVDVDKFDSPWEAMGVAGTSYKTSSTESYATLKLSGYNVEMKQ